MISADRGLNSSRLGAFIAWQTTIRTFRDAGSCRHAGIAKIVFFAAIVLFVIWRLVSIPQPASAYPVGCLSM
jgi:hypothetical protein